MDSNFEEFYFNRVEDALKKIIEDSKPKVADNAEEDNFIALRDDEDFSSTSLQSPVKAKNGSFLKRWKFI
jgi:hypothetical protein